MKSSVSQVKNIFGYVYAFVLREHSNGDIPNLNFKILETKVLWDIPPEKIYLAMKCEISYRRIEYKNDMPQTTYDIFNNFPSWNKILF